MHPLPFFFAMLVPSLAWPRRDFNLLFQRSSLPNRSLLINCLIWSALLKRDPPKSSSFNPVWVRAIDRYSRDSR
jgi:hypothetical protein